MTSLDSFFLITASICLSLFFIVLTLLAIYVWVALKRLMKSAEAAINGVEAASTMLRNAAVRRGVPTLLMSLVKHILSPRSQKKSED